MTLRIITLALTILVGQMTVANAQSTVFEGMASIEFQSAGCQNEFEIGRPDDAVFRPHNVGFNGPGTNLAITSEPGDISVSSLSFRFPGALVTNSTYNATEIRSDGGSNRFSGIVQSAVIKPAVVTPTTKLVEVFAVIKGMRGIASCTIKVRGGFVPN